MGLSLSVATLSEIPVWFYSDRLLARWGTRGVLGLALLSTAVQAFAYSLMRDPWLVLPVQLLHGPAFSAMWAAGVAYASDIAPEGMGATAQGVFAGVGMGLRSALGAFIGGLLYDLWGPVAMFRWGGVAALLALAFFFVVGNTRGWRSGRLGEIWNK
jgi:predicted MFS family arabinose efflux permease